MNNLAGFGILLAAALLLIVSSVSNAKVTAQGNDNSSEKSSTAAKTCSPEVFKGNPGLYATCVALAHNKESAASAEKPASEKPVENLNLFKKETGTIISAPIEVKKGPTMEEKKASAGHCPAGQAKDWTGICFPLKECKASISAQPGTCTQSEEEKTSTMMTAEKLEIKKPVKPTYPSLFPSTKLSYTVSQDCHRTASGKLLCLVTPANPRGGAYATGAINGAEAAKLNQNYDVNAICTSFDFTDSKQWRDCKSGFHDAFKKVTRENSVPEQGEHKILPFQH
jgi:hypothetical protein